ncbi:MAG: NAD(P)-dependent dehydrogenase (short-subunit alcohol dehydrogenase family) [Halieaceae bacterium]
METGLILGTGAPNGVGGALARRFGREDFHIVVSGRTQGEVDKSARPAWTYEMDLRPFKESW